MNVFFTIFNSVFLAEFGVKTRLAPMLFKTDNKTSHRAAVAAAFMALVASTAIAVIHGDMTERYPSFLLPKMIAGLGFVAICTCLIIEHLTKAA